MTNADRDTIFALSSGRPPAAIAVIRISGPRAGHALEILTGIRPAPRAAKFAIVRDETGEPLDESLALWFPGPHSETGEDVAELQVHGSRAVIAALLARLGALDGLRPAEAGEFTRQAFKNGKLDLTGVEGLADLIAAETDAQRRLAFRQLKGLLGNRADEWRAKLIRALALVEAPIDFSDEGDVPADLSAAVMQSIAELANEIGAALVNAARGEKLRDGMVVAIAGAPNVGKSELLNRIAGRDVAIVSPHAGTTRDIIEVHLDLGGYPVTLLDTAGIRETTDPVEMEGVRRARERAEQADMLLWVVDCTDLGEASLAMPIAKPGVFRNTLIILNKIDILQHNNEYEFNNKQKTINEFISNLFDRLDVSRETIQPVSAVTGEGVSQLLARLELIAAEFFNGAEVGLITRQRHRHALQRTLDALNRARSIELADQGELIAEELRMAAYSLGRLTGRVDVEDVLDVLFRDFCIGK